MISQAIQHGARASAQVPEMHSQVERSGAPNGPPPASIIVTPAGLERLQRELDALRERSNLDMATRQRDARSYGSDSNNDEYYALREEQMVVDARMAQLEDLIRRARVIDTSKAGEAGVAALGARVVIEDLDSGAIHTYELAGAHQEFGRTAVSAASPMGQALLGAAAGAELTVELPNGRSRSIRLISVDAA